MTSRAVSRCDALTWRALISTALAILVLAACGTDDPAATDPPVADGELFAALSARADRSASIWQPRSIAEVLPNQPYSIGGRPPEPMSSVVVVGRPSSVELAQTYRHDDFAEDGPRNVPVEHDDPRAMWRAYRVSVEVERSTGDHPGGTTFDFGISLGADSAPHEIEADLLALGTVVVLSTAPGSFDVDDDLCGVLLSGAGLGMVDDDERVSFPAMTEIAPDFVDGLETVDQIIEESRLEKPVKTI